MGDIQTRPFSKNYSGLSNQSVIALGLTILCVTGHEFMKRRRRGKRNPEDGLGSRESWEFGYLYHGRSWARFPSPPTPEGWPLSWVKQTITFPEATVQQLRGVDATLYIRFLRGCFWFTILQTLTTVPILFPIHVKFSDDSISPKSMTRASIASLAGTSTGRSLLWIHICLLFWVSLSWMATLLWICHGAFNLRLASIAAIRKQETPENEANTIHYPHPHPQYGFSDIPSPDQDHPNRGLRLRTVMVTNLPSNLRNERDLKEYFEYYMSRKVEKPSMGLTSSTQPGFLNKSFAFLFNRAKRLPVHINPLLPQGGDKSQTDDTSHDSGKCKEGPPMPIIERVVAARKMTELASLLERREDILRLLETAHIKLANKALSAVKTAMERQSARKPLGHSLSISKAAQIARHRRSTLTSDVETGGQDILDEEVRMRQLIKVLGPFVDEFQVEDSLALRSKKAWSKTSQHAFRKLINRGSESNASNSPTAEYPPVNRDKKPRPPHTIWDALLSLPRSSLDAHQPLVNLNHLFRGKTVPSIDYYTAKLNLLTSLITEQRARSTSDFEPVSTAFVTFADPADARRACKYLAVHPNNPLACLVTMAPMYHDLDWLRVMKSSFNAEFVKDWVVNIGVWGFTLFWLFPVSLLVGLVSIRNISLFWPSLKRYLDHHPWESEVIQSFLPTVLVALLALLIPLILLLIAKKAHTITTLSALQDRIMTRYYKFLIVNVLVFFCVGTVALQSFLQSFKATETERPDILHIVTDSFPDAGPFYVGWLIFTTAMHGGFELCLLGLPLIMYPSTKKQVTPRKRAVGIRPRTFNYYYWLPNHLLVLHVLLLFSVLNPFVLPFGALYFFVQSGVIKNALIHVYAKNYEGNGQLLLIRIVRYSLDGLLLSQAVFLAYMVVLKKKANVGLASVLIIFTVFIKLLMTRICRVQFERQDILEADILCNGKSWEESPISSNEQLGTEDEARSTMQEQEARRLIRHSRQSSRLPLSIMTWKLPEWVKFSYSSMKGRPRYPQRRPPNPFGPHGQSFSRLNSRSIENQNVSQVADSEVHFTSSYFGNSVPDIDHSPSSHNLASPTFDTRPVVSHPPPIPWDDQTTPDLPYDNPYYTRTIDNVLWLPRNPCGILDLDDTVDMKTSLTVEVSAGQLGTWPAVFVQAPTFGEMTQTDSPLAAPSERSFLVAATSPSLSGVPILDFDGTEEIDLPMAIAKRVQNKGEEVEYIAPPRKALGRGKLSGAEKSTHSVATGASPRHASNLDAPPVAYRIWSDGSQRVVRGRSHSIMSALQLPAPLRHAMSDQELGLRIDNHNMVDATSIGASSGLSSTPNQQVLHTSRSQNLSARQAIFHEVLAEEQDAYENRVEQEAVESKSRMQKSWLTSWMFSELR